MDRGSHRSVLIAGLAAAQREPPACLDGLAAFLDELERWSARTSISGLATAEDRVEMGVLDALPLADSVARSSRLVDVGSGNGLPGLVVALLRPDLEVVLLDASPRRTAFLRTAAHLASASNATVVRSRIEDWEADPFDEAVSRAVFPLEIWLAMAASIVRPGGSVWALEGAGTGAREPHGLRLASSTEYVLPWSGRARTLMRFTRT